MGNLKIIVKIHYKNKKEKKYWNTTLTSNQHFLTATARTEGGYSKKYEKKIVTWYIAPDQSYFKELFRVSKNHNYKVLQETFENQCKNFIDYVKNTDLINLKEKEKKIWN